jgi:hypothetical protein
VQKTFTAHAKILCGRGISNFPCKNSVPWRLTIEVEDELKTLFEFLEQFAPEASGRSVAEPDAPTAARLERFAAGGTAAEERAEICRLLQAHPHWLRWVGFRVKNARPRRDQPK